MAETKEPGRCPVCGRELPRSELVAAQLVSEPVAAVLNRDHPGWAGAGFVCRDDLNAARARHVGELLQAERGELGEIEQQIIHSIAEQELLARNVNVEFEEKLTLGNRVADRMAAFGGSWRFIIIFGAILGGWIAINTVVLIARPFDPYPFILLNLFLSCLAAVQAPVIMMSQNRQEQKDRLRAQHDYQVNLKAELEIRSLHEKMDHLIFRQWQRLLEIQQVQLDLMEEIRGATPPQS